MAGGEVAGGWWGGWLVARNPFLTNHQQPVAIPTSRLKDIAVSVHAIAQRFYLRFVAAHLRRHACHACAAETVVHHIARFGVMQNVAHDGPVGHFGMVGMGVVDGIVFALADIGGEGFPMISVGFGVVGFGVVAQPIFEEGVGAGGVIGRVGEGQDRFVGAEGEAFDAAERRVFEFLGKAGAVFFADLVLRFGLFGSVGRSFRREPKSCCAIILCFISSAGRRSSPSALSKLVAGYTTYPSVRLKPRVLRTPNAVNESCVRRTRSRRLHRLARCVPGCLIL